MLNFLMYRIQKHLSSRLFGFLPQRSTHHCLLDLYSRLSRDSLVAFIDPKSAYDVANRDIILDQLVDFGVKGNLSCGGLGVTSATVPPVSSSVVLIVFHVIFFWVHL